MNKTLFRLTFLCCMLLCFYKPVSGQPLAFPTAEGFGKYTSGGRGGRIITVTNLNDTGEGSLRHAIEQEGARIVVFTVDGTIELQSKLVIKNDSITIAGQSAPGDGICLKGYPLYVNANNVIIRFIRARMGDLHGIEDDAMGAMRVKDLIIDHCSMSWSVDECLSVYRSENVTVQWCMVTHSLSRSLHTKGAHGFGGIWGGGKATFHHNLLAHHSSRNPRFASDGYHPVDFRNNVVFNWGYKPAYGGGRHGKINFVGNYYKPGPATSDEKKTVFLDPAEDGTSAWYLSDNIMVGSESVTNDNWQGVTDLKPYIKAGEPFPFEAIHQDTPEIAYEKVLLYAGCSHRRDSYDKRVIEEVRTGTATGGETYGGGDKGIIDSQNAVGGWPLLQQGEYLPDSDGDGIPDVWEEAQGLNPNDPTDGNRYTLHHDYTNIEVYLNSLVDFNGYHYSVLKKNKDLEVIEKYPQEKISDFSKKLKPLGRIMESEGYYVWCCAPIFGEDGKVHLFYSRWPQKYGMGGWIHKCEIAHAVADSPEGPYTYLETVLAPRPGYFDATTCHNPHIQYIDGTYYLFYMGNSDGSVYTKRIGLAKSKSLYGPWERSDTPILEAGSKGTWDDCNTTNPAFIMHPDGEAWLYYKSWNEEAYRNETGPIRANRKYGLAIADKVDGIYKRVKENPIVDFSVHGDNKQVEDAYVYMEDGRFKMLMRDMGYFDHSVGLIFESEDGIHWSEPRIAWFGAEAYLEEPPAPEHLKRYGRFERPQLLMKDGKPAYLFVAMQGGKYATASGFVFEILSDNE
jgi:pectate lyase